MTHTFTIKFVEEQHEEFNGYLEGELILGESKHINRVLVKREGAGDLLKLEVDRINAAVVALMKSVTEENFMTDEIRSGFGGIVYRAAREIERKGAAYNG